MRELQDRDLVGASIVEYEDRLDVSRLRRERTTRLQGQLKKADLGAVLLFDPVNVGYATRMYPHHGITNRFYLNYALVPREGKTILFDTLIPEHYDLSPADGSFEVRDGLTWDYYPCGEHVRDAARMWAAGVADAMKELGVEGERLGIDRLDFTGMEALREQALVLTDARVPVEQARRIKTQDEIVLIRQACAIGDIAVCAVRDAIRPGVSENELFAIMTYTNLKHGGDHMDCRYLTAGGNTNPWYRGSSDRLVRAGDLVGIDTDLAGPMSYFCDISRTYLCGDTKPTADQLEAYGIAYDFLVGSIPLFRPGVTFDELAESVPKFPAEYVRGRYTAIAHGAGMGDEWPSIYFTDMADTPYGFAAGPCISNDAEQLQPGMILCVEALARKADGRESVKLEEQILITEAEPEVLSLAPHEERLLD
jgi:Xaa-Pro aminopeptidase